MDNFCFICPECGVRNPKVSKNCLICDKDLTNTVSFLEDDPFDIEIIENSLLEYKKNFWEQRELER